MKIIITENQNYLLRRLQEFVEVVEKRIDDYEMSEQNAWWCRNNGPYSFYDGFVDRCIEDFTVRNWDFFHDDSDRGGANMDISLLNKIVEENYGNYIRNLFVRKCGQSRW
jgi:serine protease inhibitor